MNKLLSEIMEIQFLPPAFQLIPKLLLLLEDPDVHSDELADLIRVDPGLTADVLRACNSAYFASAQKPETLQEAIMRLGLREIYKLVMRVIASDAFNRPEETYGFPQADLWNHSLATATAARILARDFAEDPELCFTLGLLHDIGKLVLSQTLGREYGAAFLEPQTLELPPYQTEMKRWNMNHADLGGQLLKRWNFPPKIVTTIQFHHAPAEAGQNNRLAALVDAANYIAYYIGQGWIRSATTFPPHEDTLRILETTEEDLQGRQNEVNLTFRKELEAFR